MPRPTMGRWMHGPPMIHGFRPFGMPRKMSNPVELLLEEYEAIKLADYEDLTQEMAAERMGVSRPTFTRIYDRARKKIAKGFVEALPIIIAGGNVRFRDKWYKCLGCNRIFKLEKTKEGHGGQSGRTVKCPHCGSVDTLPIEEIFKRHFNRFHR